MRQVILLVHGLEISILNFLTGFKCKTNITFNTAANGEKIYGQTNLQPINQDASNPNFTVIIHIVHENKYEEIAYFNAFATRFTLAQQLFNHNYELIVLGFNCERNELKFIHDLIPHLMMNNDPQKMQLLATQERIVPLPGMGRIIAKDVQLPGGSLSNSLTNDFPKRECKSKRPDLSKIKHVKFYDYLATNRPFTKQEEIWPVNVVNGKYEPVVRVNINSGNLLRTSPTLNSTYHILICSGKEYNRIMSNISEFEKITLELSGNYEIFYLMGCFNFDWSEIDLVHQIILKHSQKQHPSDPYNVFTIGIGMFTTIFENPDTLDADPNANPDTRQLPLTSNQKVIEFAMKSNEWCNLRTLTIFYLNTGECVYNETIILVNGRYVPQGNYQQYHFSIHSPYMNYAFVVMDPAEVNPLLNSNQQNANAQTVQQDTGTVIFLVKATNFQLYDLHIIPRWVEYHRGDTNPNRITILGAGRLDTTYQYLSSLYQVLYTPSIVPNALREFRDGFLHTVEENKVVSVYDIDKAISEIRTYPMHTINGFYDPVVLSDKDIFKTKNGSQILFLIMGGHKFNDATGPLRGDSLINLRERLDNYFMFDKWSVYLVGLHNFKKNDFHLFAELVKVHTNDEREISKCVQTFSDSPTQIEFVYKDTSSLTATFDKSIKDEFKKFFFSFNTVFNVVHGLY